MSLFCTKPCLNTSKLYHCISTSGAEKETAPLLFAPMLSHQHTCVFTTTNTLFPTRTSHTDVRHVPIAKDMPGPGVTTQVTANKHKRQAPNPQSWVHTAAVTHLGRLPFLHLPALASMWEQSRSSTRRSSSFRTRHSPLALLSERNLYTEMHGHTVKRSPKGTSAKSWGLGVFRGSTYLRK